MDEFSLIDVFFKSIETSRNDVVFGIGDDAACLNVPKGQQLLVSTDTLVVDVHFCADWNPYDIACKAVMVNVSDIAAMAGTPCWVSLALTLPSMDECWLRQFSHGLRDSLKRFDLALIGGDTTRGPLSITITVHGLVPIGKAVRRNGAKLGDKLYISGRIGAAALMVEKLFDKTFTNHDRITLMDKLQHPQPRVDLRSILESFATAAIDISDGLSADLNHICVASHLGACLIEDNIPIHDLVKKYKKEKALDFALGGGDDYELCFTVPAKDEKAFLMALQQANLNCYLIGEMELEPGLRLIRNTGDVMPLSASGYHHL